MNKKYLHLDFKIFFSILSIFEIQGFAVKIITGVLVNTSKTFHDCFNSVVVDASSSRHEDCHTPQG
jgi:hypothetical protein